MADHEIPEMDVISDKHEALIPQFLKSLFQNWQDKNEPLPPSWSTLEAPDQRLLAYKFLTARKWVLQDALTMAIEHEAWKLQFNVDTTPYLPTPFPMRGYDAATVCTALGIPTRPSPVNGQGPADFFDKCHKTCGVYYQSAYHYWDKTGHPVFYQLIGKVQVRGVFKQYQRMSAVGEKPTVPVVKYHIMENEVGLLLAKYNDLRNGKGEGAPPKPCEGAETTPAWQHVPDRRVMGITVVIDCDGLGYGHVYTPAIELLRAAFATDAANYPELVHRILLVNCPSMIKFLFNLIRGALDARVQQKITFVTPQDTPAVLGSIIDKDKVPKCFGGECDCPGGCIVMPSGAPDDDAGDGETQTEDITVTAGKVLTKTVEVLQGDEVTWEFVSTTGYDIKFSATFLAQGTSDDDSGVEVVPRHKIKDDAHSYRAPSAGKLVLVWDNHSSWFKAKKLQMRVVKQTAVVHAGDPVAAAHL